MSDLVLIIEHWSTGGRFIDKVDRRALRKWITLTDGKAVKAAEKNC